MRLCRYLLAAVLLLGIISNVAGQGPIEAKLMITPPEARVEPGQGIKFQALLVNSQGGAMRIEKITWSAAPENLGKIGEDGFFMAGREEGEVKIFAKAQVGPATYAAEARVIIGKGLILPIKIVVEPGEAIVPPLGTQQFKAVIITAGRQPEPAARVKWEFVPENLAKIEPNSGLLQAGERTGVGVVVALVEFEGRVFRGEARVIIAAASASLAGTVKDQKSGNPIEKAVVWAEYIGPFRFARRVETDAQGNYALEKLLAGVYVLRAEAKNYLPEFYKEAGSSEQATPVRLAENEAKKGIDFTLSMGATISGTVTDDRDAKTPLAGAHVVAILVVRPDLKELRHNAITDEKGNYTISQLPKGTYAVLAEAAGYRGEFYNDKRDIISADHVSVQEDQKVGDINFTLSTASAISGKVIDAVSKAPIAKALVSIHVAINSSNVPRILLKVPTNERGEYIATVPPGAYIVAAEAGGFHKEFFEEARELSKAKRVEVTEGKHTTGINFTMDKLASVAGTVTDESTGKPIAGAIVVAFQERPTTDALIGKDELRLPYSAKTDENGNYKIEGVRAGKFFVQATARGYLAEFWKEAAALKDAVPVEVPESGNVEKIDFTLGPGGAIAGLVASTVENKPIAGASIQIFARGQNAPMLRGATGRDGKYRIDGLPSGEYIVFASAEGFNGLYYKDVESRDNATPVKVEAPNETADIDFHLKPFDRRGGTVAGVVSSEADNNPVSHAFVLLLPMSTTNSRPLFAQADEFGRYKISGIPAGKYVALAHAPRFISEYYDDAKTFREAKILSVENNVLEHIDFALTPAQRGLYQITGSVRYKNQARGAENVIVQALDNGVIIATALTGSDGNFTIEEVPAGEFKVSATSTVGESEQQVPVSVGNGRSVTNVVLTLGTTSVEEATVEIPTKFELEQNYPNPFNPETTIKYHLPARVNVALRVYNALGQELRMLVNNVQDAGVYTATWDGKDNNGRQLSTGLYLFRLEAGDFVMTRKMAMVK